MVEAEVPILPGAPTRMWTYGGTFPGPPCAARPARRRTARFAHRLPASGRRAHRPPARRPQPLAPTTASPAASPRASRARCSARVTEQHRATTPDRAGRRPHLPLRLHRGRRARSARRSAGTTTTASTPRAATSGAAWPACGSPTTRRRGAAAAAGDRDLPLMICDRSFDRHNQLTDPFRRPGHAPFDRSVGRRILVNGAVRPFHRVRAAPVPPARPQRVELPLLQPQRRRRRHASPRSARRAACCRAAAARERAHRARASASTSSSTSPGRPTRRSCCAASSAAGRAASARAPTPAR